MSNKTKNYQMFKIVSSNRDVDTFHVKRLVESIKKLNLLEANPIIVNKNMEVIDGQHRLEAAKILFEDIYWVEVDAKNTSEAIVSLNSSQKNWVLEDYIRHYAKLGLSNYQRIIDIIDQGHVISNAVSICSQSQGGAKDIKTGKFICGLHNILDLSNICLEFQTVLPIKLSTVVVRAVITMVKNGYIHKEHFPKIRENQFGIQKCASPEQYVTQFETIINKGKKKGRVDFFNKKK